MGKREKSRALTKQEFENILNYCWDKIIYANNKKERYIYYRNLCFFSILWFIGCRPKEGYAAILDDFDLVNNTFRIRASSNKLRKPRIRKIPEPLKLILIGYLRLRNNLFPHSPFLLPSNYTERFVDRVSLQRNFDKIIRVFGLVQENFIDKKGITRKTLNLYSIRKGHATYLYEQTGDPYIVQKSLDHEDISTTIKFYIKTLPEVISNKIVNVFNQ